MERRYQPPMVPSKLFLNFFHQSSPEPSTYPTGQPKPPIRDPGRFWHGLNPLFSVTFGKKTVIFFPII
jgi:hypothetical protein